MVKLLDCIMRLLSVHNYALIMKKRKGINKYADYNANQRTA